MDEPTSKSHLRRSSVILSAAFILFIAISAVAVLVLGLHRKGGTQEQALTQERSEKLGREVNIAEAKLSSPERNLLLIGETRPYFSVTIFGRVSGYMTKLLVDIGDNVKAGQLLAHVESPESQQAYNSAQADELNRRRIANRYQVLLRKKLVSPQEAQQFFASSDIGEATRKTQEVVRDYQNIVAPFDGRITQRFVDPGALIQNASGSQSASQPMFTISQINRLRIFIYVDQKNAPYVHTGDPVEIINPTRPGEKFNAKVEMIAGELDPKTRTLLVEIFMDNHEQKIVAGSFVQVAMKVRMEPLISLPIQALVMEGNVSYVPRVDSQNKVHYAKVDLVENTGKEILLRSGVKEGDRVALNVGMSLQEGQKVRPTSSGYTQEQAGKAGGAGG